MCCRADRARLDAFRRVCVQYPLGDDDSDEVERESAQSFLGAAVGVWRTPSKVVLGIEVTWDVGDESDCVNDLDDWHFVTVALESDTRAFALQNELRRHARAGATMQEARDGHCARKAAVKESRLQAAAEHAQQVAARRQAVLDRQAVAAREREARRQAALDRQAVVAREREVAMIDRAKSAALARAKLWDPNAMHSTRGAIHFLHRRPSIACQPHASVPDHDDAPLEGRPPEWSRLFCNVPKDARLDILTHLGAGPAEPEVTGADFIAGAAAERGRRGGRHNTREAALRKTLFLDAEANMPASHAGEPRHADPYT